MMTLARAFFILTLISVQLLAADGPPLAQRTALDRYIAAPDHTFKWSVVATTSGEGYTMYVVDMTSQTWRTGKEVDRTQWRHWVTIIKPDTVRHDTGFLFITGGDNGGPAPTQADGFLVEMAKGTASIVAEIRMVPNQPLTFIGDDRKPRWEDDLIAHTWIKFMTTGDEAWPARNPMTKAAVRAMDTVTAVMARQESGNIAIDRFVVAGGSKRGWTTWTTAAVDKRVVAIVPIVIDVLNAAASMRHHYAAYGFWAPAVGDYIRNGVVNWIDKPEHKALMAIEDPYSYHARYTMPKLIINATGDQYFLPDSSRFYFNDLPGEKHLRYVPNADHSLRDSDARQTLYAFYESVLNGRPRPRYSWSFDGEGSVTATTLDEPTEVKLWQATNPDSRDFRVDSIGKAFHAIPLDKSGSNPHVYRASVMKPERGWTAWFVELTFDSGGRFPLKLTTPVRIIPDTLPFKDKPLER